MPLADLIRRQLDVKKTGPARNMAAWRLAIQIEAQHDVSEDQGFPSDPSNGPPSVAPMYRLATAVECDKQVIRSWRKKPEYHRDVETQRLQNKIDEGDPESEKGDAPVAWVRDDDDLDRFVIDHSSNDVDKDRE